MHIMVLRIWCKFRWLQDGDIQDNTADSQWCMSFLDSTDDRLTCTTSSLANQRALGKADQLSCFHLLLQKEIGWRLSESVIHQAQGEIYWTFLIVYRIRKILTKMNSLLLLMRDGVKPFETVHQHITVWNKDSFTSVISSISYLCRLRAESVISWMVPE